MERNLLQLKVTSLFTNIPLEETINIAIEVIFQNNPNINISQADLKKVEPLYSGHHREPENVSAIRRCSLMKRFFMRVLINPFPEKVSVIRRMSVIRQVLLYSKQQQHKPIFFLMTNIMTKLYICTCSFIFSGNSIQLLELILNIKGSSYLLNL